MQRSSSVLLLFPMLLWGCDAERGPTAVPTPAAAGAMAVGAPAPSLTASINSGGTSLEVWPYTDTNFDATPQDPVNLVFVGADPRSIRNALMAVDGNRTGPFAAFTCTWTDAAGAPQTTWSEEDGWTGSVIQLECGAYQSLRFHIRLFPAGEWTLANAHIDVLIPGTPDHQVLSWEVAEGLVTADLAASGLLLAAPAQTGSINEAPFFRTIPAIIYNGLPPALRALAGGPAEDVTEDVGIFNNGSATILSVGTAPAAPGTSQAFTIVFGQTIPKPFCTSGNEFVRVDGPVELTLDVAVSPDGVVTSETLATGNLTVRTVNPLTGAFGDPMPARVRDHYTARAQDDAFGAARSRHQMLMLPDAPPEDFRERLRVGPHGLTTFQSDETCSR